MEEEKELQLSVYVSMQVEELNEVTFLDNIVHAYKTMFYELKKRNVDPFSTQIKHRLLAEIGPIEGCFNFRLDVRDRNMDRSMPDGGRI